jgi:hypothetical protein
MVVHVDHGLAGGLRENAGDHRMDNAGASRSDQACADCDGADAVACPTHSERSGMLEEKAVNHAPWVAFQLPVVRCHGPCPSKIAW